MNILDTILEIIFVSFSSKKVSKQHTVVNDSVFWQIEWIIQWLKTAPLFVFSLNAFCE